MESTPKSGLKTTESEVDLGLLFYKTGSAINGFLYRIGRGFTRLGNTLLSILFYLRRNIIWLILGLAVGLGFGMYQLYKTGLKYSSSLIVKTNFNSSRSLYGAMDFFNSLINSGSYDQLAGALDISPEEAQKLVYFEASPVQSEVITSDMYRAQFLHMDRAHLTDTFWMKPLSYTDFKKSLTKFDYPLHTIKAISTNSSVFVKIQDGILKKVSSNKLLQNLKTVEDETTQETLKLLQTSISSLDSLRASYTKRIASGAGQATSGNNLTLMEGTPAAPVTRIPELEVYDKMLALKDELNATKKQSVIGSQILQVYVPFSYIGEKEGFLQQNLAKDAISGVVIAIVLVLLIGLYKYLKRLENTKAHKYV